MQQSRACSLDKQAQVTAGFAGPRFPNYENFTPAKQPRRSQ